MYEQMGSVVNRVVAGVGAAFAAGVTVVGLIMAPAAMADETGPDSVACATANAAVLRAALAANAEAEKVDAAQGNVLAGLKAVVKEASDKVDAADAIYQPLAVAAAEDDATAAAKKAAADALKILVAAQADLNVAVANLASGPQLTPAQKAALDKANDAVADAIKRRAKACEFVTVTTTTPPPTTTVAVVPPPVVIPKAIDTGYAA